MALPPPPPPIPRVASGPPMRPGIGPPKPSRGEWGFAQDTILEAFKFGSLQKAVMSFKGLRDADFQTFPTIRGDILAAMIENNPALRKIKFGLGNNITNPGSVGAAIKKHAGIESVEIFGLTLAVDKLRENKTQDLAFRPMGVIPRIPGSSQNVVYLKEYPDETLEILTAILEGNQSLRKFDFGEPSVNVALVGNMIKTCSITELALKGNVGTEGLTMLLQHGKNSLVSLRVTSCNIIGGEFISALKGNSTLTSLDLTSNKIEAAGARMIAEGLQDCKLNELNLSRNLITAGGVSALLEAANNTSISTLGINFCGIENVQCLEALRGNKTLSRLLAEGIGKAGILKVASVLSECKLTEVIFSPNEVGEPESLALLKAAKNSCLKKVRLMGWGPSAATLGPELEQNQILSRLDVSNSKMEVASAKLLAKAIMENKIDELVCNFNRIGSEGTLAILAGGKNLVDLQLASCELVGSEFISMLRDMRSLTRLDLARNKIDVECAKLLANSLADCKMMTELDLSGNEIGMDGATALFQATKNTSICCLKLDKCGIAGISNVFLRALTDVFEGQTSPTTLSLASNRAEASWAKALLDSRWLHKVRFSQNFISIKELRESPSFDASGASWFDAADTTLMLTILRSNIGLKSLSLSGVRFFDPVLVVELLRNCTNLTQLTLESSLSVELTLRVKELKTLTSFTARNVRGMPNNLQDWVNDIPLTYLDLSGSKPSLEALAKLLKSNHTLQTLVLDDEICIQSIRQEPNLNLSNRCYSDDDAVILASLLEENKGLTSLNLATNCIGDKGLAAILACTQHIESFVHLNVSYHQGKSEELLERDLNSLIASLSNHHSLKRLDISAAGQWDLILSGALKGLRSLEHLNLTGHRLTPRACQPLAKAMKAHATLASLQLTDRALISLGQFREQKIEDLSLANQDLNNVDALLVVELLGGCSPQSLDWSGNQIGSKIVGAEPTTEALNFLNRQMLPLSFALKRTSLKSLNLSSNRLIDADVPMLCSYLKGSPLLYLDVRGNDISPDGARALVDGLLHSGIQKICVGCELSVVDLRQGKAALDELLEEKSTHEFGLVDVVLVAGLLPDQVNTSAIPPKLVSTSDAMMQYVARVPHDAVGLRKLILHGILDMNAFNQAAPTRLRPLLESLHPQQPQEAELLKLLVEKGVFELKDDQQRSYLNLCTKAILDLNNEILLFCGRFKCTNTRLPEHRSATCMVFRAFDERDKVDVVLKLMKYEDQYRREVDERKDLVGSTCVLEILSKSDDYIDDRWARDTKRVFGVDYTWGIVMPAAQRNLMIVLLQERVNLSAVRGMMRAIIVCLGQMHDSGRVHGDLKPNNIVRMPDESIRLIDLDATAALGTCVGAKSSTAYCPPEMTSKIHNKEDYEFRLPTWEPISGTLVVPTGKRYELLNASIAFDMWSLGAVIYRAVVHKPLLEADDSDNLRGKRERLQLARWGPQPMEQALADASIVLREEGIPDRERHAILDLLRWLLQLDPAKRPSSCADVLAHAFFEPQGTWQLSNLQYSSLLGEETEVQSLLKNNECVLSGDKTPLHLAAEEGHSRIVEILLEHPRTEADALDSRGFSALQSVLFLLDSEPEEDELATRRLQVVRALCSCSDLELLTNSNPPVTTLELGRKSRNEAVRYLFESEMVLQLLLGALKNPLATSRGRSQDELAFNVADFIQIWNSTNEYAKKRLAEAVFKMLDSWGLEPCRNGTLEGRTIESEKKHHFIRKYVLPLPMWQTDIENWKQLQSLAKSKQVCVLQDLCRVRDAMMQEGPEDAAFMLNCRSVETPPLPLVRNVAQFILEKHLVDDNEERRKQLDRCVFVPLARTIATNNEATFLHILQGCLNNPPMEPPKDSLLQDWNIWLSVAPVKGESRMQAKVEEYSSEMQEEKRQTEWPFTDHVRDTLRAMVVCRNIQAIRFVWEALEKTFQISSTGRIKNNLNATNKPQDILINAVLNGTQVVEIQIHHHEILAIKENDLHLLYEILRARQASDFARN